MAEKRIPEEDFIGREQELDWFKELLSDTSPSKILNIYGEAGIGKTQLLLRIQSLHEKDIIGVNIDYYDLESRSKYGLLKQLISLIDKKEEFSEANKISGRIQRAIQRTEQEKAEDLSEIEQAFKKEYKNFAEKSKKIIIFFFDSYEYIQEKRTLIPSGWLEKNLFPGLIENVNTCVVIAGRKEIADDDLPYKITPKKLLTFVDSETAFKIFWEKFIGVNLQELQQEVPQKSIDWKKIRESLNEFTENHPVLLRFFAEIFQVEWKKMNKKIGDIFDSSSKDDFYQKLVNYISSDKPLEYSAIHYLWIADFRVTFELLSKLLSSKGVDQKKFPDIFENLKSFSFIKYKLKDRALLLHKKIHELFKNYLWKQDPDEEQRKGILISLIIFYKEKLITSEKNSEEERQVYVLELIEYISKYSSIDTKRGLERLLECFYEEFDRAIQEKKYDYCELLIDKISEYEKDAFPANMEIFCRTCFYEWQTKKRNSEDILQSIERNIRKEFIFHGEGAGRRKSETFLDILKLKETIEANVEGSKESEKESDDNYSIEEICRKRPPIRMLHLSDLHFDTNIDIKGEITYLAEDIKRIINRDAPDNPDKANKLDYLIITGDLTQKAEDDHFENAKSFISQLLEKFDIQSKHCVIVPGNHDQSWDTLWIQGIYTWKPSWWVKEKERPKNDVDKERYFPTCGRRWPGCGDEDWPMCGIKEKNEHPCPNCQGYLIRDSNDYAKRFDNFADFFESLTWRTFPPEPENQSFSYFFHKDHIQIVAFNSCWKIDQLYPDRSHLHEAARIKGLENAKTELEKWGCKDRNILRIAVFHHPVIGDEKIEKNDEVIVQFRKHGIQLILHGHVHENRVELIGFNHPRQIYVTGAGAFGARKDKDRPPAVPCLYNLLEIQRDFSSITVHTRHREPTKNWEPYAHWEGDDPNFPIPYYKIELKKRT